MDYYDNFLRGIRNHSEFVRDGAINPNRWNQSPTKVLYVLKETYGYDGCGQGWSMAGELERKNGWLDHGREAKTYKKIAQASWLLGKAVDNGNLLPEEIQIPSDRETLWKAIQDTSIINISKTSSQSRRSSSANIKQECKNNNTLLRWQIESLKPKIIVAGSGVCWECLSHSKWGVLKDIVSVKVPRHIGKKFGDVWLYHANHPSAWTAGGFNPRKIYQQLFSMLD